MESLIEKAYSPEAFRKGGHELIDILADYLEATQNEKDPSVFKPYEPDQLFGQWNEALSEKKDNSLGHFYQKVKDSSIHLHNPGYMGHQVSPVLPEAALAEMFSALFNNGVGVYEMGSPTVAMERVVIKQLAQQLGYHASADGILTSGGTLGNLTALLAARQIKAGQDPWNDGTKKEQYGFMVSEQAHYCIDRAAKIMGWGNEGIVKVPVDDRFRMDPNRLQATYEQAQKKGIRVLGIVGSACSTATGSFDPLPEIARFCSNHNLWFHVDAAHGGGAAYSGKYRPLLEGIEKADSVVVDFHKMLMFPALVTGLIFKEGNHSYRTFAQKADYLWSKDDEEWFNLGKRTFECTKNMMALKVYAVLKKYGPALFEEIVDQLFDLGKTFAQLITARPQFELAVNPQCNIVCFRHIPEGHADVNNHNKKLRKKIIDDGQFFIVQTTINGEVYLRTTLMNVHTTPTHLSDLLDRIEEYGK